MEKRQPLSVMIALQSKKMRGDGGSGDSSSSRDEEPMPEDDGEGKYDDPGLLSACDDMLDAFRTRDGKALNEALCHWMEIRQPSRAPEPDKDDRN